MHRATPSQSSFRGYSSGGSRSVVGEVDDTKFMQEMAGNFMHNEARKAVEAAQNFGFTSVTMDAIKSALGKIVGSAETFMSFMGGNRGFPAAGNIDDRRHRMMGLEKGEAGMFGTQGMMQQIHSAIDGLFHSVPNDKTMRMALLDDSSQKDMTTATFQQEALLPEMNVEHVDRRGIRYKFRRVFPRSITNYYDIVPFDSGGASGGAGAGGGATDGMKMGQQSLKDKNKKASIFFDFSKDSTRAAGKIVQLIVAGCGSSGSSKDGGSGSSGSQGTTLAQAHSDGKFYCGGDPSKGKYALIVTLKGPTKNVPGKIG